MFRYHLLLLAIVAIATSKTTVAQRLGYKCKISDGSCVFFTGEQNYAVSSPQLASKNWRSISVNGQDALIVKATNEILHSSSSQLGASTSSLVTNLRDQILSSNGASYGFEGENGGNQFGSRSVSGDSAVVISGFQNKNNFGLWKPNLPFDWSRVILNNDLVTFVYKNNSVETWSVSSLCPARLSAIEKLRQEAIDTSSGSYSSSVFNDWHPEIHSSQTSQNSPIEAKGSGQQAKDLRQQAKDMRNYAKELRQQAREARRQARELRRQAREARRQARLPTNPSGSEQSENSSFSSQNLASTA